MVGSGLEFGLDGPVVRRWRFLEGVPGHGVGGRRVDETGQADQPVELPQECLTGWPESDSLAGLRGPLVAVRLRQRDQGRQLIGRGLEWLGLGR